MVKAKAIPVNTISFSKAETYTVCAKSYQYKYKDKISSIWIGSPLIFGNAIDNGLNVLLEGGSLASAVSTYLGLFKAQRVNDDPNCKLRDNPFIVYSNADFDFDLLTSQDLSDIAKDVGYTVDHAELYSKLREVKKQHGFKTMPERDRQVYNLYNWHGLMRKGLLMLEAYDREVMPKFSKVVSIQERVSTSNSVGDKINGLVDLIADVKEAGRIILDNKTASKPYKEDSVRTSGQLALYKHLLEGKYKVDGAGYIVLNKELGKKKVCSVCGHDGTGKAFKSCNNVVEGERCNGSWDTSPYVKVQFIIDQIPADVEEAVINNMDIINDEIKKENFPKNTDSCKNYWGQVCPYYDLCHHGSMDNLVQHKKEKHE